MDCKGCNNTEDNKDKGTLELGRGCKFCKCGDDATATACTGCYKLNSYDWLEGMPELMPTDIFEVRFKNTRKSYFKNVNDLPLKSGDIVAVEASPGHDIGIVSLTGDMVAKQMKRVGFNPLNGEFKKIYRKAKPYDIEKWQESIALEHNTMIKARQIAAELGLNMKIGDVEYQGDKIKAIFYYIADERVDFRELIKIFADQFRIRIEMKQIGARQEAGRIGGLGSCGRELCCASWISSFVSVTTNSARHQEISLNPQKLAGQCGKLKCCLVYELDTYLDARKDIPRIHQPLQTLDADYFLVKTDILSHTMWFSTDPHSMANMKPLHVSRVKEIIQMNQKGKKADKLDNNEVVDKIIEPTFANVVGEDSLTRFDKQSDGRRKSNERGRSSGRGGERGERSNENRTDDRNGERGGERNGNRPNNNRPRRDSNQPKAEGVTNDATAKTTQNTPRNPQRPRPNNGSGSNAGTKNERAISGDNNTGVAKVEKPGIGGDSAAQNSRESRPPRNNNRNRNRNGRNRNKPQGGEGTEPKPTVKSDE